MLSKISDANVPGPGDSKFTPEAFQNIEEAINSFRLPAFCGLTLRKRFRQINQTLCELILKAPAPAFLFSAVLDFFDRINREKFLNDPLDFPSFEFWLNHFSNLTDADNYEVRAKIVGKLLPRDEYQAFFPIGMDKVYFGSHFITAHLSPDVDTMIASFWGWMDAFGARVGSGLHLWCLPGGPPESPVTSVFRNLLGKGVFSSLARESSSLTLSAMDLVTQKRLFKELGETVVEAIDHGSGENAVILVNAQGHYLGDWHSPDSEAVRQITILFKAALHWFENNLHSNLISLFAKADLTIQDLCALYSLIFDVKFIDCEPVRDFNEKQKNYLNDFIIRVLGVEKGLDGTFRELNKALFGLSVKGLLAFQNEMEGSLASNTIFDGEGRLKESRPLIFNYLKELIRHLDDAIFEVRKFVERLDVLLDIKYKVLGQPQLYVTLRSDVEEMRQKMQDFNFLTVVIHEHDGSLFPVGIIRSRDLRGLGLGTVSLRDFCNLEEMRMASYLEVISVIDHHKSSLKTQSVPTALIGDAQSCNVLIAELMFAINDKYSLGGMTLEQIEGQIQKLSSHAKTTSDFRILQRLMQRKLASKRQNPYFVHPRRELTEYICFLHAILDDTDLLTKASYRDLDCVAQLLNRIKSLSLAEETEIITFDDLPRDKNFVQAAAPRILKQSDMYAFYKQIYDLRETDVELHLKLCVQGQPNNIFLDTKEQNGCARVGQTKIFASNYPLFSKESQEIRRIWLEQSREISLKKPEIDLYIHMWSTIANAEEVYSNETGRFKHKDELWLWCTPSKPGFGHLNAFLAGFQGAVKDIKDTMSLEFLGSPPAEFTEIFDHHFPDILKEKGSGGEQTPIAVLRFKAGALNSRKSMISPFLPRLV